MMKKIVLFAAIVLVLALSACKVSPTDEAAVKTVEETAIVQQWTYQWISALCVYDGGSGEVVCKDLATGDNTYLGNLLNTMSQQGWELDEVVHTSDNEGMIQTFIFRKPFTQP
jgi:hypothetical protein